MVWELVHLSSPCTPWLQIFCQFGLGNRPFVFGSWATSQWPARQLWVDENRKPNIAFLRQQYGHSKIPLEVSPCSYETVSFSDFLDSYEKGEPLSKSYLKDWHFQKEFGTRMYSLHPFCSMDWINCEAWTEQPEDSPFNGDYRFVYFGVAGTSTRLHSDVVASYSWSANICGRKLWLIMPPGREKIFLQKDGQLPDDIRPFTDKFSEAEVVEFVQNPGEIVFVPSGWYHQVHNLDDSISINHNWINAANIPLVTDFLLQRFEDVNKELKDSEALFSPDEFKEQIELVLFADARLSMRRLRSLFGLIQETRNKVILTETAECYVCPLHYDDVLQ